jgi:L-threonylcarbamoyladenylate synthase
VPPTSADFYAKAPPDRGASSFVYPATGANIAFFAKALEHGCLVAIPTETVYGLAGLALDEAACRSIFSVKGRPLVDPLIVHVAGIQMAEKLAELPVAFATLTEALWPGPLTIILKKRALVPDLVTAGKSTVALRMPRHPVALALLKALDAPLAAPSANPFGYVSPTRPEHVTASFSDRVPFIIDGGPCDIGLESTILDLTDPARPQVLRPGAISAQDIGEILKTRVEIREVTLHHDDAATAPGTFSRHYSPRTKLSLFETGSAPERNKGEAVVHLKRPEDDTDPAVFWLSENGEPEVIARSLFTLLRSLDEKAFQEIHIELPGTSGIGLAVRDRLKRAAAST